MFHGELAAIGPYVLMCYEQHIVPRFQGVEALEYLWQSGYCTAWVTRIRVMYIGILDGQYVVGEDGKLYQVDNLDQPLDCRDVLSVSKHPEGWDIENLNPARVRRG